MSEERHLRIAIILFLVSACFMLVLAGGVSGEGTEEGDDVLLIQINDEIEYDVTLTTGGKGSARIVAANSLYKYRWDIDDDVDSNDSIVESYMSDLYGTYDNSTASVEEQTLYNVAIELRGQYGTHSEYDTFKDQVIADLTVVQQWDGGWNNDAGDTALATYGLIIAEGNTEPALEGIKWLQEYEDKETHSWGTIDDDSKAILALDSAGVDVWDELAALMLKQRPDGSFGGIEETSWAVIALSTNPNEKTMMAMDKAVAWLRNQDYDNNEDLALAALAEQYYEDAKFREEQEGGSGGGSGFIPPPGMYVLSIFILGAIALSYWLFARLERDGILDGPRKDIYKYVTDHPGEHLAKITKTLDLSSSSVRYHLSVLEGMDLIVNHKNGKYKRFYINKNGYSKYTNGNGYKHIMSALKNNTARNMVKYLLSHPKSNQKRVSKALDIHPSTVTWHAKRLEEAEIISKQKKGKEIHYSLNSDVQLRKVIGIIEGSPAY